MFGYSSECFHWIIEILAHFFPKIILLLVFFKLYTCEITHSILQCKCCRLFVPKITLILLTVFITYAVYDSTKIPQCKCMIRCTCVIHQVLKDEMKLCITYEPQCFSEKCSADDRLNLDYVQYSQIVAQLI